MTGTVWTRISDFPNYAISTDGRIVRITAGRGVVQTDKALKISTNPAGYQWITLRASSKSLKTSTALVHRLLAKCFIPNPDSKPEVNHIDGNKRNNALENLEWVTRAEHQKRTAEQGLVKGEHNGGAKLKRAEVLEIRDRGFSGEKHGRIAADYGITRENVSTICRHDTWGWL